MRQDAYCGLLVLLCVRSTYRPYCYTSTILEPDPLAAIFVLRA